MATDPNPGPRFGSGIFSDPDALRVPAEIKPLDRGPVKTLRDELAMSVLSGPPVGFEHIPADGKPKDGTGYSDNFRKWEIIDTAFRLAQWRYYVADAMLAVRESSGK